MRFYSLRSVRRASVSRFGIPLVCMGIFLSLAQAAQAQITFTLSPSSAMTTASSEVFFSGTITNTSSSLIYLNGLKLVQNANTTPTSGVFTTDSAPFYNNAPSSLSGGSSVTVPQLFGIVTSSSFNAASQFYGTATLNGGLTMNSMDTLGTPQNFYVSGSAMPEPSAFVLLASGLMVGLTTAGKFAARRRRANA